MPTKQQLEQILEPLGQQHLLQFWEDLSPPERQALADQVHQIDFAQVERLYRSADDQQAWDELASRATPPSAIRLDQAGNEFTVEEARVRGGQALASGEVGVVVVAGGQGTRLGFEHPKGMYPIGPVSGAPLMRILIEKIIAMGRRHGVRIPLYMMTSDATHEETTAFLHDNDRFGLLEDDLHIFCQGTMPAVDMQTGRLLLREKGRLMTSPDGHGGMLQALQSSGGLDEAVGRGLQTLFYMQVDNPLVPVCDAEFIGYHDLSDSEISTLVVAKRHALDRLGNVVVVDGKMQIIEYSDVPDSVAERQADDGSLLLWAGSIGIHLMQVEFLQRVAMQSEGMPFHIARKKVPYLAEDGQRVQPEQPNAIKFERFFFDLLPEAHRSIVVERNRSMTYGPLKNASGSDEHSPEHCRQQMIALHRSWLRQAGAELDDRVDVEISPLWALDAQSIDRDKTEGLIVKSQTYFR